MLYEEVELTLLRFMEYYDHVDYFVVVESSRTFRGNQRVPVFEANSDMFAPYLDKVIYLLLDNLPSNTPENMWVSEVYQRNAIASALKGHARLGDLVIVSDADELWDTRHLPEMRRSTAPMAFSHQLYYYWLDYLSPNPILGCCAYPYGYGPPQEVRQLGRRERIRTLSGGWHYSYLGGLDRVANKLENLSDAHTVADRVGASEDVRSKMARGVALWDESIQYAPGNLNLEAGPRALPQLIERFPHLVSDAVSL